MKCKYFRIYELVSPIVYYTYGEKAWEFIDEKLIMTLDAIREHFDKPITVNDWYWQYKKPIKDRKPEEYIFKQRGYRCNLDDLVKSKTKRNKPYCSQHCLGKAVDINVKNMSPDEVYNELVKNHHLFPYLKRIENRLDATTWTHIDCANVPQFKIFNAKPRR